MHIRGSNRQCKASRETATTAHKFKEETRKIETNSHQIAIHRRTTKMLLYIFMIIVIMERIV